ncbi:MAG TPA: hypothetical protein VGK94_02385 [Candidatus Polarisedimenticolia bacterium]
MAATENRIVMKSSGEMSSSARLMTTNVQPQTALSPMMQRSA